MARKHDFGDVSRDGRRYVVAVVHHFRRPPRRWARVYRVRYRW